METGERVRNDIEKRTSEENFEDVRTLSPIEEEFESALCLKMSANFDEPEGDSCKIIRPIYKNKGYRRKILRKMEGDSSSGDEQIERDHYQLRRVKGSYCCFGPDASIKEAEASGDNDVAESGLRDKSLKTTVKQLMCRLSQVEREIVALKRYESPRRCHEECKVLQRDLLTWRDEYEKRIATQIIEWQLAEKRRIHDGMENMGKVYDNIERHLGALEKENTKSHSDFRRQIDAWEKRLKEDVVNLYENNLMELREQFKAWFEMQIAINPSNARKEKCEAYKPFDDTAMKERDESRKSIDPETTLHEDNAKFLRRLEHIVKFEVQQHRDDLVKRMDQKIAELWSAFGNFKHNFHLDRDYRQHNYIAINNDETESVITESWSDCTCQETAKSYLHTDSEEICTT